MQKSQKQQEVHRSTKRNRLEYTLSRLQKSGQKALAVFLMGGDPNLVHSEKMFRAALDGKADILEIGVPFSDPLADGPVIQDAAARALQHKTSVEDIFSLTSRLRADYNNPIVLLTYWNPIYQYGPELFFQRAGKSGVDGLVIPDLPYEEKGCFKPLAETSGVLLIDFLTPMTREERAGKILKDTRGFVYCVTISGVTGERGLLSHTLPETAATGRRHTKTPLLAGFGISTPDQAVEASRLVDGVIVGSALVKEVEKNLEKPGLLPKVILEKVSSFRRGLDQAFPLDAARG